MHNFESILIFKQRQNVECFIKPVEVTNNSLVAYDCYLYLMYKSWIQPLIKKTLMLLVMQIDAYIKQM